MNFSVTGEPAPSQLDQKRKSLMQSMLSGGPGAQRLLGQSGGLSRGYSASDSPNAAIPNLTFNPFLAQLQRGVSNLSGPTADLRGGVNDLTGSAGGLQAGGGLLQSGLQAGGAAPAPPQDLASLYAQAGIDPSSLDNMRWGGTNQPLDDPTGIAPPIPPPLQYMRPTASKGYAV